MAINMPVQGTAADIMKIAMIRTAERLAAEKLNARMILQVHDELVLEVEQSHVARAAAAVRESMENAFELSAPLLTELQVGPNWAEMEPLAL